MASAAPDSVLRSEDDVEAADDLMASAAAKVGIIACGAIAKELVALLKINHWTHFSLHCLPAKLHNRPELIPDAVEQKILQYQDRYDELFIAYADCGTGGLLDKLIDKYGIKRLPGAHCYEFFAGSDNFAAAAEQELGTFYLTDFMVRHFERLIIVGMGLDRFPQLKPMYFGHYKRVLYLSQLDDVTLIDEASRWADWLELEFEHQHTGFGHLDSAIQQNITWVENPGN